ncbi:MAG: LLM class F420-dependent oxidoreductase [Acidimicrobiia bacterium]|nr:LLM class F420-dependent oxidoreductase [Acidimicrobiia bacterium]
MSDAAVDLGRVGVWTFQLDLVPSSQSKEAAAELEELGYGAVWVPEAVGREAFTNSAILLSGTERMAVATGIASIWARDAMAAAAAHNTLTEAYPGRFLLGLGVSHQPMVDHVRGHTYDKPYSAMVKYLDAMDSALFMAATPSQPPQRVLAALGPKMLALAAERAAGAHPYFVPPEHTAFAREHLGADPLLAVEQAVVLETDPAAAREIARAHMSIYIGLPNYANNLRRLGFTDDDLAAPGSDRLVDAIVAWGTIDDVVARVAAHHDAGADHVCIQALGADATAVPVDAWRRLAPALLG